jgi:hypothetical protein
MIGKKEFIELMQEYNKQYRVCNTAEKVGLYIWAWDIIDWGFKMFDIVISSYFTEEGVDWIDWYRFDKNHTTYDENGNQITVNSLDELYDLIEKYRK